MKKIMTCSVLAMLFLAGCGKPEVGFDTLETARKQAKENASFNAAAWRSGTPGAGSMGIIANGDSTQKPECPQGDGWASVDLVDTSTGAKIGKLKCSTVSASVGCMTDEDFKSKVYAGDDGRCQDVTKVPHPLPKIAQ